MSKGHGFESHHMHFVFVLAVVCPTPTVELVFVFWLDPRDKLIDLLQVKGCVSEECYWFRPLPTSLSFKVYQLHNNKISSKSIYVSLMIK